MAVVMSSTTRAIGRAASVSVSLIRTATRALLLIFLSVAFVGCGGSELPKFADKVVLSPTGRVPYATGEVQRLGGEIISDPVVVKDFVSLLNQYQWADFGLVYTRPGHDLELDIAIYNGKKQVFKGRFFRQDAGLMLRWDSFGSSDRWHTFNREDEMKMMELLRVRFPELPKPPYPYAAEPKK